jgi:hypothetical protein
VYEAIEKLGGNALFAPILGYGDVVLSNYLGEGFCLLLPVRSGIPLESLDWNGLSKSEQEVFNSKFRCGIKFLRALNLFHSDCHSNNVLFDKEACQVTLLDLEAVLDNEMGWSAEAGPEVDVIPEGFSQ